MNEWWFQFIKCCLINKIMRNGHGAIKTISILFEMANCSIMINTSVFHIKFYENKNECCVCRNISRGCLAVHKI